MASTIQQHFSRKSILAKTQNKYLRISLGIVAVLCLAYMMPMLTATSPKFMPWAVVIAITGTSAVLSGFIVGMYYGLHVAAEKQKSPKKVVRT